MSDFIDATQEYGEGSGTNTTTNEGDISLIDNSGTSEANNLIRMVENTETGIKNIYILQTLEDGEIRFLTKDADTYNDISDMPYNTKIGSDGKLYCYWTYDFTNNPLRVSGWYDIMSDVSSQGFQLSLLEAGTGTLTIAIGTITNDIIVINGLISTIQTAVLENATTIGTNTSSIIALNIRVTRIENKVGLSEFSINNVDTNLLNQSINAADNSTAALDAMGGVAGPATEALQASRVTLTSRKALLLHTFIDNAQFILGSIALGAAVIGGIRVIIDNQKKEQYKDEVVGIADTLTKTTISTTEKYPIHTGITITSGNSGFITANTTYRITIQREAVLIIYISPSFVASVENVEEVGTSTFTIGETITIPKASLGGGTGGDLVLSVATLGTLKTWSELRIAYLQAKIEGIDTKNRRKAGVIGADDIDTTQFTTTDVSYTNTTEPYAETITYKQLKSRINWLPSTGDVDVYTEGFVGMGRPPDDNGEEQLVIYRQDKDVRVRIQSESLDKSCSIEFIRGIPADTITDYRFISEEDTATATNMFRLQFQELPTQFGDGNSYIMDITPAITHIYNQLGVDGDANFLGTVNIDGQLDAQNFYVNTSYSSAYRFGLSGNAYFNGRVGIATTPHSTYNLDVNGSSRLTGNVGVGTQPHGGSYKLDVLGSSRLNGNVGVGTTPNPTYALDVLGTSRLNGNVGIGTAPSGTYELNILGDTRITTGSLHLTGGSVGIGTTEPNTIVHIQDSTSDTRLTIEDVDTSANGLPSDIVFPDTAHTSVVVNATDKFAYINNTTITSSQSIRFTLLQRMEVDLLLVGGGGAGGFYAGGGGGGGGIFYAKNLIMEAGNYIMIVGRGGIGQVYADPSTTSLATGNGQPTSLCYDDGLFTSVKFNLGGTIQEANALGGGRGASNNFGGLGTALDGYAGGSGGGCTEGSTNAFAQNTAGATTQPATFWNGTTYVVGGTAGRRNTTTAPDRRGGGGGGGTASSPADTSDYTCGKDGAVIQFLPTGAPHTVSAGGGSACFGATDETATTGLGGKGYGGTVFGGYGVYRNNTAGTLSACTAGNNNTGSGGGGSGIGNYNGSGGGTGLYTASGNGGTGIALIRYRLAERKNNVSLDLFRNYSSLVGYSVGNYGGQFKVIKQGNLIAQILMNPLGNVAINSRYNATQIFQVGEKGGRLRIANDEFDFTQIGVNDEYAQIGTLKPCIKIFGTSRTDGKAGNIEHTCGSSSKHILNGNTDINGTFNVVGNVVATGTIKSNYSAFHAISTHGTFTFAANTRITGVASQGWDTILIANPAWNATTGVFTCPITGIYRVCCSAQATSANHGFSVRLNATNYLDGTLYGRTTCSVNTDFNTSILVNATATNTISVYSGAVGCFIGTGNTISIVLEIPL